MKKVVYSRQANHNRLRAKTCKHFRKESENVCDMNSKKKYEMLVKLHIGKQPRIVRKNAGSNGKRYNGTQSSCY